MQRAFQTTLLILLLLTVSTPPALARITVGVTSAVMPGIGDRSALRAFEEDLSARFGEPVQVRSFDSETAQLDWLIRFREIDVALVDRNLLQTLSAGTLIHLADLPSAIAVTHPGVAAAQHETLSRGFRSLSEDDRGRRLLSRLAGSVIVATDSKGVAERLTTQPVLPAPLASVANRPVVPMPAPTQPASAPSPVTLPQPPRLSTASDRESTLPAAPALAPSAPPAAALPPEMVSAKRPVTASAPVKTQPATPAPAAMPPDRPTSPKRTSLLLAALVVLIGIGVKVMLLMRRWMHKQKGLNAPPTPPAPESITSLAGDERSFPVPSLARPSEAAKATAAGKVDFDLHAQKPTDTQAEPLQLPVDTGRTSLKPAETAPKKRPIQRRKSEAAKVSNDTFPPVGDELVVEQGRLGKIKVPALLKSCAELPQPVILRVRSGESETCVHFAGGQICHAYSRNWRIGNSTKQWGKLGYLMIRDGVISETQHDQAMELIERQQGLRFAAALQQLGILDLEALRHILARQAKTVVFALILFSSGEYRIETDNGAIPAEESIAMQVESLIREASHHQAEWTAIRKVLPNMGTLLDFAPDGREKLDQVRLSVQQQLMLSQFDGQTPISTLCCDSTMMDYEVSRFIYLMVKTGVLQVVPAA